VKRTTSAAELLLQISRKAQLSLREQVEHALRSAIQAGRLKTGFVLPATRALAKDLRLSRGVVVLAYEQLLAEGYLTSTRGSGTRVAAIRRTGPATVASVDEVSGPPPTYDFRPGSPDVSLFPRRAWLSSLRRILAASPHEAFAYPDPGGPLKARAALSGYLNRTRGTLAHPGRVVMCNGFAQGLRLVCAVLRERGVKTVAVEDPGHAGQRADIESMGLGTRAVQVDESGIDVDRLTALKVGAVLLTPAHQFPAGVVLSPGRRKALLEWATRQRVWIIEDDYDAEFRYDRGPVGALQGLAEDRVIYLGSASKTLAPALRLGWIVSPAELVDRLALAKLHADHGSPTLDQLAFADFIERGELDRHLRKARHVYRRRRDATVEALRRHLPSLTIKGVAAGLHVMVNLSPGLNEDRIEEAAALHSLWVYGVRAHRKAAGAAALLLGYGSLPEARIGAGIALLATIVKTIQAGSSKSVRPKRATVWDPIERRLKERIALGNPEGRTYLRGN
jgi:GntR family transcriptional regulator/MocR family aminotransferase